MQINAVRIPAKLGLERMRLHLILTNTNDVILFSYSGYHMLMMIKLPGV